MANTEFLNLKLPATSDNIADQINIDTPDNLNKIDASLKAVHTIAGENSTQINTLGDDKTDRVEIMDYKSPSDAPGSYKSGLTIFYANHDGQGGLGWSASTGITGYGLLVTTFKATSSYIYQQVSSYSASYSKVIKFRTCISAGTWSAWQTIETKEQPNWITATLQNGWTGNIYYRKNQIGQLEIQGVIVAGTLAANTIIATLQSGYEVVRITPIVYVDTTKAKIANGLMLNQSRELRVYAPGTTEMSTGDTITFNAIIV